MFNRISRPGCLAAMIFALAVAGGAETAHAEDHFSAYDSGISSRRDQAAAAARTAEQKSQQARNAGFGTSRNDAAAPGSASGVLGGGGPIDDVYREIFQPGNPVANTK